VNVSVENCDEVVVRKIIVIREQGNKYIDIINCWLIVLTMLQIEFIGRAREMKLKLFLLLL
jgi:hypothetical protein